MSVMQGISGEACIECDQWCVESGGQRQGGRSVKR